MSHHHKRPPLTFLFFTLVFLLPLVVQGSSTGAGAFKVQRRFVGGQHTMADLRNHDANRHARLLSTSAVTVPLGGNGLATLVGLYYTKIGIGTPPKNFTVQIDTGSDVLWVNCASCRGCRKKGNQYDVTNSTTGKQLGCNDTFCSTAAMADDAADSNCTAPDTPCPFNLLYGDGFMTSGYYATDVMSYSQVTGDHETEPATATVTFGCATEQNGTILGKLDGLIGFGQANSSTISQLGSSGKVRKIFAHCLDTINGGGIFAIGNVIQPNVTTAPLLPYRTHYTLNLTSIEVGNKTLILPIGMFAQREDKGAVIDSGTTLAYLPDLAYRRLMDAIFAGHGNLAQITDDTFTCFMFDGDVDEAFPTVTFHFGASIALEVKPHQYLFKNYRFWCVGWQNGGKEQRFLLGDLTVSNKLVIYDLENQTIGWTDYNCSTTIEVEDEVNRAVRLVDYQNVSSGSGLSAGRLRAFLLPLAYFLLVLLNCL